MDYYKPPRTYHDLNSEDYPDHSRPATGANGVLRSMWRPGEQMWDEDMNNSFRWLSTWTAAYVYWRQDNPRHPYYAPSVRVFVSEPDKTNREPYVTDVPLALVWDGPGPPEDDWAYEMWKGSKAVASADRVGFGKHAGTGIRGLFQWQEYVDAIEIAFFFSETRKNRILGAHTVVEPFRLHMQSYSSRVRNWPRATEFNDPLAILKNGTQVGWAWKSEHSSGITMFATTEFAAGDVLAIKQTDKGGVRYSVTVSICGELL